MSDKEKISQEIHDKYCHYFWTTKGGKKEKKIVEMSRGELVNALGEAISFIDKLTERAGELGELARLYDFNPKKFQEFLDNGG